MTDIYQQRYLEHQKRKTLSLSSDFGISKFRKYNKKEQKLFFEILKNRNSQRVFNDKLIDISPILEAIKTAPSSCNRRAIIYSIITDKDSKELLSKLLVGGVRWIHKANTIILLAADMIAYKSPNEKDFMPYLDAGVIIQTIYLTCEAMNYGCCYVNPNIRKENKKFFKKMFSVKDNWLFCGAIAIGKYDKKHKSFNNNSKDKRQERENI